MPKTYQQIMEEARRDVPEASVQDVRARLERAGGVTLLDVREKEEYREGHLAGAISLPRGFLEMRVEETVPDKDGADRRLLRRRHALADRRPYPEGDGLHQRRLDDRRLHGVEERRPCPSTQDRQFTPEQLTRYSRHFMLPEVGEAGQAKLLDAKVLLLGAGGLGSPTALYLAAAGVGTLGIVDHDVVDLSNLQRQILHTNDRIGMPKVESARLTLDGAQPRRARSMRLSGAAQLRERPRDLRQLRHHRRRLRQLPDPLSRQRRLRDARQAERPRQHLPVRGQATVFDPGRGPCYRCLFPEPPPPGAAPSCAEAGVLGVLPGLVGCVQALETIKLILGAGRAAHRAHGALRHAQHGGARQPACGAIPKCPVCGEQPTVTKLIDYEEFCGLRAPAGTPSTHAAA